MIKGMTFPAENIKISGTPSQDTTGGLGILILMIVSHESIIKKVMSEDCVLVMIKYCVS